MWWSIEEGCKPKSWLIKMPAKSEHMVVLEVKALTLVRLVTQHPRLRLKRLRAHLVEQRWNTLQRLLILMMKILRIKRSKRKKSLCKNQKCQNQKSKAWFTLKMKYKMMKMTDQITELQTTKDMLMSSRINSVTLNSEKVRSVPSRSFLNKKRMPLWYSPLVAVSHCATSL